MFVKTLNVASASDWRRLLMLALSALCGAIALHAQTSPQAKPELVLQTGHTGPVNAITLSPDGRFLVSASDDTTLKLWDTASGNVLRTLFGHEKSVLGAA